jgi:hypothetical protein
MKKAVFTKTLMTRALVDFIKTVATVGLILRGNQQSKCHCALKGDRAIFKDMLADFYAS